ncbi:Uma2 family endonuclease [Streptomyces sp. NPDC053560]|uniref:Uma2 family endonuclease n=1 Tax=Streptomyces sp. NPDC053560 TaxID=3365711 RepID=UPI0037D1B0F4
MTAQAAVGSRETAGSDYGKKKAAYATAGIPVYLIADPYAGERHLFTLPEGGRYRSKLNLTFGDPVDLTGTALDLTLETDAFPRD